MGQQDPHGAKQTEMREEQPLAPLGADQLEGSSAEKSLGILLVTKLTKSQQWVKPWGKGSEWSPGLH